MDVPPAISHQIVSRELMLQKRELTRALAVSILAVGKNGFTGGGRGIIWALVSPFAPPDQHILLSEVAKDQMQSFHFARSSSCCLILKPFRSHGDRPLERQGRNRLQQHFLFDAALHQLVLCTKDRREVWAQDGNPWR